MGARGESVVSADLCSLKLALTVICRESAGDILEEYFNKIGGREAIFEETEKAARGKKRRRQSAGAQNAGTKRSRKKGSHPDSATPPAAAKKWSPPSGSWEDDIDVIDACEEESSGKLVIYLNWKNGQKTKHDTSVIYKKCPQKVRDPVVVLEGSRELTAADAAILRTACQDHPGGKQVLDRQHRQLSSAGPNGRQKVGKTVFFLGEWRWGGFVQVCLAPGLWAPGRHKNYFLRTGHALFSTASQSGHPLYSSTGPV